MSDFEDKTDKAAINRNALILILLMPVFLFSVFGAMFNSGRSGSSFWFYTFVFTVIGCVYGFVRGLGGIHANIDSSPIKKAQIGGNELRKAISPDLGEPGAVPIGNTRMPIAKEPLHTVIEGATGTGKTQILKTWIDAVRKRGDVVVVVDSNYDLYDTLGQPGDIILSPFDDRSPGWFPTNEVHNAADWAGLASSFVGEGSGDSAEWHAMARAMFAAVSRNYWLACKEAGRPFSNAELFELLTSASPEIIRPLIAGTPAASLADNERGLNSVRMSFIETLKFWPFLKEGGFSIRDWVETKGDRPSIFIPYRKRNLAEMKNLISAWLDQMIIAACDGGSSNRKTWIIIDELSGLGEIPALLTGVTELRKTGFRVVVGLQDFHQLRHIYGPNRAETLLNNLSNKVILRANSAEIAERQSRLLGEAKHIVTSTSYGQSSGQGGSSSTTTSYQESRERIVSPEDLTSLPDLTAYVKFSGDDTVRRTAIQPYKG